VTVSVELGFCCIPGDRILADWLQWSDKLSLAVYVLRMTGRRVLISVRLHAVSGASRVLSNSSTNVGTFLRLNAHPLTHLQTHSE
jgi:hypothetical protein